MARSFTAMVEGDMDPEDTCVFKQMVNQDIDLLRQIMDVNINIRVERQSTE